MIIIEVVATWKIDEGFTILSVTQLKGKFLQRKTRFGHFKLRSNFRRADSIF